jgi:mannose-6-phosphate isomerase-like protein (cupin superfamily)
MRKSLVTVILLFMVLAPSASAQRRGASGARNVTFVINVSNPAGAPVGEVKVTLSGPASRTTRTERGRSVFEGLPAGVYRMRFEKTGYVTFEREVTGRGSAPIDVNVTINPVEGPPPAPVRGLPPPPVTGKFVVLDMPAYIERNYVGKAAEKMTQMACGEGGNATLVQINVALVEHTHAEADEFVYVIAGEGSARMGERVEPLGPGVFMMIPRGTAHAFAVGSKKPLVFVSTRAGDRCLP